MKNYRLLDASFLCFILSIISLALVMISDIFLIFTFIYFMVAVICLAYDFIKDY
jgi:hypothetical protein